MISKHSPGFLLTFERKLEAQVKTQRAVFYWLFLYGKNYIISFNPYSNLQVLLLVPAIL